MADVTFSTAAAAYANGIGGAVQSGGASAAVVSGTGPGAGGGFADLVNDALSAARDTGLKAEGDAAQALKGEVSLHEVVTSVTSAEVTLQTVVAMRDRVISAYNDILRMPI